MQLENDVYESLLRGLNKHRITDDVPHAYEMTEIVVKRLRDAGISDITIRNALIVPQKAKPE